MQIIWGKRNSLSCKLAMSLCTQKEEQNRKHPFFLFFKSRLNCRRVEDSTQRNTSRFSNNNINNGDWQPPYRCLSAPTVVEIVNTEHSLYGLNVIWKNPGTVTPLAALFFHSNILHFSYFIFVSHLVQEAFNLLFHISVPQTSVKDSQRLNSSRTPK